MGVDQIFWTNQKNYLIWIIALLSPQMFDKVIFEIVMGTHIFNFGGSLTIIFKSFKCETMDPTSNKGSKLQLESSFMIKLCKITHPMRILLIWPCPIVYLDCKWLQIALETPQNKAPHLSSSFLHFTKMLFFLSLWIMNCLNKDVPLKIDYINK
jgi:hypothetical protein